MFILFGNYRRLVSLRRHVHDQSRRIKPAVRKFQDRLLLAPEECQRVQSENYPGCQRISRSPAARPTPQSRRKNSELWHPE